jgi:hypothetical protein
MGGRTEKGRSRILVLLLVGWVEEDAPAVDEAGMDGLDQRTEPSSIRLIVSDR